MMGTAEAIEEALNPERLLKIAADEKVKGTGGSAIALPDGQTVTRDVIMRVVEELLTDEMVSCDELAEALGDERVHIRFGALKALQLLTEFDEPDFYPFLAPDTPDNAAARDRWQERCESRKI